ncbi:MAG TPA: glycosyltransferase [Candidatus Poseidoniaceae archaeon]|nr:glycosyltransferase [Candidatus Poseidoniaceae archaeon]
MGKKKRRKVVRRSSKPKIITNGDVTKTIKSKISITDENKYGLVPKKSTLDVEKIKRELRRTRNSASYRVGNAIINSMVKPWKLVFLPFKIVQISWELASERLGIKDPPRHDSMIENENVDKKSIVVFPTNGVGFGHFTRILAIAKRIKKRDQDIEIIFFTTMPTLHILKEQGKFVAYHIPGRKKFKNMDARTWNTLTEEFMENIFAIHRPNYFIFDGAFPYRGMLNSISNHSEIKKFWLRRGTLKKGITNSPIDSINKFDYVIRPKDSVELDLSSEEEYNPDLITCNPILLLDKDEMMGRKDACARLGVPENATIVYVQLGAGNINDIDSEIGMTLDVLKGYEDVYVVLGESMIGDRLKVSGERIRIIRDYPNSRFFEAFDFAIMAAGYNSFHEAVQFSLPTIFYPNMNTGQDDQLARAVVAENVGAMVVLRKRTKNKIAAAIERLYDNDVRKRMKKKAALLHMENGADQIAKHLIEMINEI